MMTILFTPISATKHLALTRRPGFNLDHVAHVRRHQTFQEGGVPTQNELIVNTDFIILPHGFQFFFFNGGIANQLKIQITNHVIEDEDLKLQFPSP